MFMVDFVPPQVLIVKLCQCDTLQYDGILNKDKSVSTVNGPCRRQSQVQRYIAGSAKIFPFLFSITYRPTMGSTKSPTQWVLEAASPWTRHWSTKINTPPSSTKAKNPWSCTSIPLMTSLSMETKKELQPGSLIMNYIMNCTMNEH